MTEWKHTTAKWNSELQVMAESEIDSKMIYHWKQSSSHIDPTIKVENLDSADNIWPFSGLPLNAAN